MRCTAAKHEDITMKKTICALIVLNAVAGNAVADITVKQYREAKAAGGQAWDVVTMYIAGYAKGYMYANIALVSKHQKTLYCPPPTLALNTSNFVSILDEKIKDRRPPEHSEIEILLALAIPETFPCPK
jgi:hypothetical protein